MTHKTHHLLEREREKEKKIIQIGKRRIIIKQFYIYKHIRGVHIDGGGRKRGDRSWFDGELTTNSALGGMRRREASHGGDEVVRVRTEHMVITAIHTRTYRPTHTHTHTHTPYTYQTPHIYKDNDIISYQQNL